MEKTRQFILRVGICFVLPQMLLAGCSLIGLGIGAIVDGSSRGGEELSILTLRETRRGTSIAVTMRDGQHVEGDYMYLKDETPGRYKERYASAVREIVEGQTLPVPGDSVEFSYRDTPGPLERGEFRGVDPGTMVLGNRRVLVSDIGILQVGDSARVNLWRFGNVVRERRLPFLLSNLVMTVGRDTAELPVVDVVRVEINESRNAKWIGLGIGAAVDAVVGIILLESMRESCENSGCYRGDYGCEKRK